jgi:hypothetical protein
MSNRVTALDSHVYYFEIGKGSWRGTFSFRITDFKKFFSARLGFVNKCLCLLTHFLLKLFGPAKIGSRIEPFPERSAATNDIFMKKLGLVIYRQVIEYRLDPDGEHVTVVGWERHGPIPFLLKHTIEHWGAIHEGGMKSTYRIPMLGDTFVACYAVAANRNFIESHMQCPWAEAQERLWRAAS